MYILIQVALFVIIKSQVTASVAFETIHLLEIYLSLYFKTVSYLEVVLKTIGKLSPKM